ncbi:uncharacterized protein LOC109827184 [Asparagus officinalis]|uniref:uncharacterized protein LOC109827184 n=1 Tax=Asparagus officinalis TaxID=4686 RepID=UPI00098E0263|nr:uncharacterized protein LOC109827184 [Asparagus officinalis]
MSWKSNRTVDYYYLSSQSLDDEEVLTPYPLFAGVRYLERWNTITLSIGVGCIRRKMNALKIFFIAGVDCFIEFALQHSVEGRSNRKKERFLKVLKDLKLPDDFSSNFSGQVQIRESKIIGLKSHDYHVLMQQLLPLAMRTSLRNDVGLVLNDYCSFFRELCSKVIDVHLIEKLEQSIPIILCKLERIFPPAFFDVMVHLTVHLAKEAKLAGPVQYRWMYPIERYLLTLKNYVRNRSRPEGSIAEGYLMEEATIFCARYLDDVESKLNRPVRLQEGPLGTGKSKKLSASELHQAYRFILDNMESIHPYRDKDILIGTTAKSKLKDIKISLTGLDLM